MPSPAGVLLQPLEFFIPKKLQQNPIDAQRASILVGLSLMVGTLLIAVGLYQDYQSEVDSLRLQIQFAAISVLFIGPVLLRITGSLFSLVLSVALIESAVLMAYTQMTGGLNSSGLFWYPIIPVMSLLYLRPRWGMLFLSLFVLHVLYMTLSASGVPSDFASRSVVIGATVPSIVLVMIALVYIWLEQKARAERDRSEEKYRQLLQSPLQGLLVLRGAEVVLVNDAAIRLFGCESKDDLLQGPMEELFSLTNSPSRTQLNTTRKDGSMLRLDVLKSEVDWDDDPATQVLLRDVTDEYQSKIELEQLNSELERRISERTRDLETNLVQLDLASRVARLSYWEWRTDEATIQFSSGMAAILGTPSGIEALPVDGFLQLVHDEDRARVVDEAEKTFTSGAAFDIEYRIIIPGKGERWFYCRGEAVDFVAGERASRIAGSVQDVTERRQEHHKHLEEQKRESLGAIAAGLAHDFNNILTPITAYADLITKDPGGPETKRFADVIGTAAGRAATLVHQILSYAREAPDEKSEVRLSSVVNETLSLLKPSLPKSIRLELQLSELPVVWADPTQLHAILMNLCVNARDAMPSGGVLTITLREVNDGKHQLAEIKVTDTGTGIDPETRRKMFEPYFTTKSSTRGTGLGLAIVDGIAREMGGSIDVDSAPGQGTTMTLLVPMLEPPEHIPLHTFRQKSSSRQLRVLIVDDDPDIVDVMQIGLNSMGHRVSAFTSGHEAAEYLEKNRSVDLLVVDKDMPEISGPSLVAQASDANPSLMTLMVSGRFEDNDVEMLGVSALLEKPFTVSQLAEAVGQIVKNDGSPRELSRV